MVTGRGDDVTLATLHDLVGTRVAIEGFAFVLPSGSLHLVDVDGVASARMHGDDLSEHVPFPAGRPLLRPGPVPQDELTDVGAMIGMWPGDETDAELLAALEDLGRGR